MQEFVKQDRSLAQRVLDRIKTLIADIRNIYNKLIAQGSDEIAALRNELETLEKIRDLFFEALDETAPAVNQEQKNTAEAVKYSLNTKFSQSVQEWFDNTTAEERKTSGERFLVGTTTDVLKSIGVKDYNIYFGASKINKIMTDNDSMTLDVIKQAVGLLEEPILVMESKTVEDSIVIFGEVYTKSNKPVMISVLLNPKN